MSSNVKLNSCTLYLFSSDTTVTWLPFLTHCLCSCSRSKQLFHSEVLPLNRPVCFPPPDVHHKISEAALSWNGPSGINLRQSNNNRGDTVGRRLWPVRKGEGRTSSSRVHFWLLAVILSGGFGLWTQQLIINYYFCPLVNQGILYSCEDTT